jgi:hypothetical protein
LQVWDVATKLYHMYASEILHHCGIYRWVSNSIVVHATSAGAADGWEFVRQGVVKGPVILQTRSKQSVVSFALLAVLEQPVEVSVSVLR